MDDRNQENKEERVETNWDRDHLDRQPSRSTPMWLMIIGLLFLATVVIGGTYAYQQYSTISSLAAENKSLNSVVDQMHTQMNALTDKINQMATPPAPPAAAPTAAVNSSSGDAPAKSPVRSAAKRTAAPRTTAEDRRIKALQSQVDDQKKQLTETQDQLAAATSDLNDRLSSSHDELSGTIAKNHDELVALEKRGERSFFEFDLTKSKGFIREGPIQISLRKADTKHQSYDLMMLMNDHQLSKKKVDLYEPIWLHDADQPEAIQLVVNEINKDHIHGYVSSPKYRESELASNNTSSAAGSNAAAASSDSTAAPSSLPSTPSAPAASSQGHSPAAQ
jgi:uncharacterized coiled-coil protein SlyX